MQTVPGAGEVHVKEEASEFIVSSHTIFLFCKLKPSLIPRVEGGLGMRLTETLLQL